MAFGAGGAVFGEVGGEVEEGDVGKGLGEVADELAGARCLGTVGG